MVKTIIQSIPSLYTVCRNFITFVLLFCMVTTCFAMDVTLEWDSNTETDRAGYRIYYDTYSGPPYDGTEALEGDSPIDVKIAEVENGATARYTLTGLNEDETYFFALKAYNTSGNESGYSKEVSTGNVNGKSGGSGCFIYTLNP